MSPHDQPITLGEAAPDLPIQTADGGELRLSAFRGRPLVLVCVRYYG